MEEKSDAYLGKAQRWMQQLMDKSFAAWLQSKAGKRYLKSKKPTTSPYDFGFSVREDVRKMQDAMARHDEEVIKGMLVEYPSGVGENGI